MTTPIDFKNAGRPIHVGVILMGGTTELLDIAPVDAFQSLDKKYVYTLPDSIITAKQRSQAVDFEFHWISETGKPPSLLTSRMSVIPTHSFETCPPLDIVMLGASDPDYEADEQELAYIRQCWGDCSAFLSICAGMQIPLKAGILDGKTATAPRPFVPILQREAPNTNWVEKRWVRDGKLWTSGAVFNGLDLVASFCQEAWGGEEGGLVHRMLKFCAWPVRGADYDD